MNTPMDTRKITDPFYATTDDNEMVFVTLRKQDVVFPLFCCDCAFVHLVKLSWHNASGALTIKLIRDDELTTMCRDAAKQLPKDPQYMRLVRRKAEAL